MKIVDQFHQTVIDFYYSTAIFIKNIQLTMEQN